MGYKLKIISFLTLASLSITAIGCQGQIQNSTPDTPTNSQTADTSDNSLGEVITQVANDLGVNEASISQLAQKQSLSADDLAVGSVVSQETKQPLDNVIQEEKQTGDWDAVIENHQADAQKVKKALQKRFPRIAKRYFINHHPGLIVAGVSNYLGISKQEVTTEWKKYQVRPVALLHAAVLSKLSGKPLDTVLSMRMNKTTWVEIGKQLNVSGEQLKAELKKINQDWKTKVTEKNKQ